MAERNHGRAVLVSFALFPLTLTAPLSAANDENPCVVRRVQEEVTELRKRPWLGGELEVSEDDGSRRIRMVHLAPEGPLAAAGAKVNDVILAVAGVELSAIPLSLGGVSAGNGLPGLRQGVPVVLRLRRDGAEQEFQAMPSRLPNTALPDALGLKIVRGQGWFSAGEITAELPAAADDCLAQGARDRLLKLRQQAWLGIDHLQSLEHEEGTELHVLKLDPEGPLAAAGVQEGDLILAVDGIDFSTMLYRRARLAIPQVLDGLQPGRPLHLRLRRGDSEIEVEVTLPALRGYPLAKRLGSRLLSMAKIYFYEE